MEILVIILYVLPTVVLFFYSCIQLNLVWNYWTAKSSPYTTSPPAPFPKQVRDTAPQREGDTDSSLLTPDSSFIKPHPFPSPSERGEITDSSLLNDLTPYPSNRRTAPQREGNLLLPSAFCLTNPFVTIQLPIYNERYVVERLIDTIALFDYPKDRFEIQILDDSTDETSAIIATKVTEYQAKGVQILQVRRTNREGFKAGALAYGLQTAKGELIAIFDADFVPQPDFLKQTVPYFQNPKVGVVQTRWGHLNEDYSLLTRLQAFGLDGHFVVEQGGRHAAAHFINFNGTAGVWRKECITDAGGWSADTLTEDLDLSYRAQVRGWQFVYLPQVETPAELPATMPALKSQQYRWMKGGAECAVKNIKRIVSSPAPFSTKLHGIAHLLNSGVFVAVLMMALVSVPTLLILHAKPQYGYLLSIFRWFQASVLMLVAFYWTAHHAKKSLIQILIQLPLFLTIIMGLSLHNAVAVIEGYLGRKTPFMRTPKWGIVDDKDRWQQKQYLLRSLNGITIVEIFLTLYFAVGIALGLYFQSYQMLLLHIMLTIGYGTVSYYSVKHSL